MKKRHPFTASAEQPFSQSFAIASRVAWTFKAKGNEVDIDIYDQIGEDIWGEGTSAADFIQELRSYKDATRVNLHVNSPGGYVNEGLAIYNAIQQFPAEVVAYVEGQAASAASFIVMAADKVVMFKTSSLFIHDAMGVVMGNAHDMRIFAGILDEESDNIAGIYAEKAGETADFWRSEMQSNDGFGKTYRGQEAVNAGLADELATPTRNATPAPSRNVQPGRVAAQATNEDPPTTLDLSGIPPLADHAGYKAPTPNLAGLLEKHPIKIAAPRGNGG